MKLDYREVLKNELVQRQERNSLYSLRSFARDLGISPSRLSEIFNHKQGISLSWAKKISEKINLSTEDAELFCLLVTKEHGKSEQARSVAEEKIKQFMEKLNPFIKIYKVNDIFLMSPNQMTRFIQDLRARLKKLVIYKNEYDQVASNLNPYKIQIRISRLK